MALTEQQKDECERHLMYPSSGASAGGLGPPFFAELGTAAGLLGFPTDPANIGLRFRLNNLPTDIEVKVVGADHSAFDQYLAFAGVDLQVVAASPLPGTPIILQIDKQAITYDVAAGDTQATIATALAPLITSDLTVGPYFAAIDVGGSPPVIQVRARTWGNQSNSTSVAVFSGPSVVVSVNQPGTTIATKRMFGGNNPPGPIFVDPDSTPAFPIYGYLPWCNYWENKIGLSADGMDTVKADVFTQRSSEYHKRKAAYIDACRDLAQALGIQYKGGGSFDGRARMRRTT